MNGLTSSDESLISEACGGRRAAFDQLVERYFGTVWAIAYARMGRRDSADDLAQEVFLVAWLHLQSLSDQSRFAGWFTSNGLRRLRPRQLLRQSPPTQRPRPR